MIYPNGTTADAQCDAKDAGAGRAVRDANETERMLGLLRMMCRENFSRVVALREMLDMYLDQREQANKPPAFDPIPANTPLQIQLAEFICEMQRLGAMLDDTGRRVL